MITCYFHNDSKLFIIHVAILESIYELSIVLCDGKFPWLFQVQVLPLFCRV